MLWQKKTVNPQLGIEIPAHERPSSFKINQRQTFISYNKYMTICYYNLIYELNQIKRQEHKETIIRIVSFLGGGDQLYYAHLNVPPDSHYYTGAVVCIKLHPNNSNNNDQDMYVIKPIGFIGVNQYTSFLFRPRCNATFIRYPKF